MKTVIVSIPEGKAQWFQTLFEQFHLKHRTLTDEEAEDFALAQLIDEAMAEKGEMSHEEIMELLKGHEGSV